MQLAHRISLNGAQLDEIDPRILIKEIEVGNSKEAVTAVGTGSGDGTRITSRRRESTEVTVKFSLNIRRDRLEERGAVLEAVNAWAVAGGWVRINYKPNRRLHCDEVTTPGEGDLWKRLTEYSIIFRARAIPFWQQDTAVSATSKSGASGSVTLQVEGSAKTVADAELKNNSGAAINTASITIGGKTMGFENLALGNGETLKIDHVIAGGKNVVRCRIGSRSVMANRTGESADDFEISPGAIAAAFTAQRACVLTVSCRGRFV